MSKSILFSIFFLWCATLFGQISGEEIDIIDYNKIALPSLQVLFENAQSGPSVSMYEAKVQVYDNMLLTEKRSWLKYFGVGGTYIYGNLLVNSAFTNEFTPIFYQSSGITQSSYFGSANISIPLDDLFNRKNRIRHHKIERHFTELEKEKQLEEQKVRIVTAYTRAKTAIAILKRSIEDHAFAQANYKAIENDFKMGRGTITDLNVAKKMESESFQTLKTNESVILNEILTLEILSGTKIISK